MFSKFKKLVLTSLLFPVIILHIFCVPVSLMSFNFLAIFIVAFTNLKFNCG
jgi:hypothetical protein